MDIRDRYDKLLPSTDRVKRVMKIKTHVPSPSKRDYTRGYIRRYFTRRLNDDRAFIFEVNREELKKIKSNPTYLTVGIDWRITGTETEIVTSNRKSIKEGSRVIPTLPLYLPNLKQFSQITDE